eukprot:scaffold207_cov409-Prasinococcus_capsulatus_cf.AAC.47
MKKHLLGEYGAHTGGVKVVVRRRREGDIQSRSCAEDMAVSRRTTVAVLPRLDSLQASSISNVDRGSPTYTRQM